MSMRNVMQLYHYNEEYSPCRPDNKVQTRKKDKDTVWYFKLKNNTDAPKEGCLEFTAITFYNRMNFKFQWYDRTTRKLL